MIGLGAPPIVRRGLVAGAMCALLGLSACGGGDDDPFAGSNDSPAVGVSGGPPPTTSSLPPGLPGPPTPGTALSPSGTSPVPSNPKVPTDLAGRVEADRTAMLTARTMVSIIEGCHSGRDSYTSCDTHKELGSPDLLGLVIGKRRGQVRISASKNGFRITAHSFSGAKFTVARGPKGDRFKCLSGPEPGACPANRAWTW